MASYQSKSVADLKAMVKRAGGKGYSSMRRAGLIGYLNLLKGKRKRKKPARRKSAARKPARRKSAARKPARRKSSKRLSAKQKAAAKKMFKGLQRKVNASGGRWVKRKKPLYKKALLGLDKAKKIKIASPVKAALKKAVKRSKYGR